MDELWANLKASFQGSFAAPPSSPPHPISIKPNFSSPKIGLFDMEIMRICDVRFQYC